MANENVKPCPFCGNDKIANFIDDLTGNETYKFHCAKCGISTKWFPNKTERLKAWNMRTESEG